MKRICLGFDLYALVDDKDFEYLFQFNWCARKGKHTYYAERWIRVNGKQKRVHMHREIIGAKKGQIVDHINQNGLDNRRENLRIATRSQNALNSKYLRKKNIKGSSGYYGVWISRNKYRAAIYNENEVESIGMFDTPLEAARAYDERAKELGIDRLNFPDDTRTELGGGGVSVG